MRIAGGDIILETLTVPVEKFKYHDEVKDTKTIEATDLLAIVRSFSSIATSAVSPTERRIVFKAGSAYASYMWAVVKAPGEYPDLELKVKDISIVKSLLTNKEGPVVVAKTVEGVKVQRIVLHTDYFKYATISSSVDLSESLLNSVSDMEGISGVHIDLVQLYKMVELSADLPYSIGKVGFNYSDEGITLSIKN